MRTQDSREATPSHATLRQAYGCLPSGVIALCGLLPDGSPHGMAISAFGPVSLDPALVQVCIQNSSTTWRDLKAMPRLGVSVLAEGQGPVARSLASKTGDRFRDVQWMTGDSGAVLIHGASLWLETTVDSESIAGDHALCLLRICRVQSYPDVTPLVFHGSRFRLLQPEAAAAV